MKHLPRFALIVTTIVLLATSVFGMQSSPARAQENLQYQQQRQQYLDLFVAYRQVDEQFLISQQQYKQLQTLASLERAVQSSKELQIIRARMMTAYFQSLLLLVQDTEGGELSQKTILLENLESMISSLQTNTVDLETITDRIQADENSLAFDQRQDEMERLANQSIVFVKLSRVQSLNDQTGVVGKIVMDALLESELTAVRLSEKQRGYDELSRNIVASRDRLLGTLDRYVQARNRNTFPSSLVNQFTSELSTIYTQINRSITFIKELAR